MTPEDAADAELEALFDQMIAQQRARVLEIARRLSPRITADDTLQPHDVPELAADPRFNFEDGLLAGLISAQMAARAQRRQRG